MCQPPLASSNGAAFHNLAFTTDEEHEEGDPVQEDIHDDTRDHENIDDVDNDGLDQHDLDDAQNDQ